MGIKICLSVIIIVEFIHLYSRQHRCRDPVARIGDRETNCTQRRSAVAQQPVVSTERSTLTLLLKGERVKARGHVLGNTAYKGFMLNTIYFQHLPSS